MGFKVFNCFALCWYEPSWEFDVLVQLDDCYFLCYKFLIFLITRDVSFNYFALCCHEPSWEIDVLVQLDVCYYVWLLLFYETEYIYEFLIFLLLGVLVLNSLLFVGMNPVGDLMC